MKPYLLIAGYNYYPASGTSDWIGTFATKEEAEEEWEHLKKQEYPEEWYEIVDAVEKWLPKESQGSIDVMQWNKCVRMMREMLR